MERIRVNHLMEPRPQRPRSQIGQAPSSPPQQSAPGAQRQDRQGPTDFPDGVDPATFIAPSRTDYDYSPLDLAPPGQRRRRQFVAAAIGGFTVLLLGALAIFGYLILRDDQPSDADDVIAAQTELAQSQATIAAQATVVAQAASAQTAVAGGGAAGPAATPPTDAADAASATGAAATEAAGANPTAAPTEAAAAGTSGPLTQEQLTALLPDAADAPAALDIPADTQRELADVVEALGGTRAAETNLETWGWTGNVERSFNASDPAAIGQGETSFLSVSVHGFATPEAAAEALPFFSDILVEGSGYQELEAPNLGDLARLLQIAEEDGTTNVALYVQDGTVLYRVGASATGGDPTPDVVSIMTAILEDTAVA